MIAFLDRLVGVRYTGPVVLVVCALVGVALAAFFAWWDARRPLRCPELHPYVGHGRCRSEAGHGGRHCADMGSRLLFWGPF